MTFIGEDELIYRDGALIFMGSLCSSPYRPHKHQYESTEFRLKQLYPQYNSTEGDLNVL